MKSLVRVCIALAVLFLAVLGGGLAVSQAPRAKTPPRLNPQAPETGRQPAKTALPAARPRDAVQDVQTPRHEREAKMSRGKPLCVGPTARLSKGMTFEKLAQMTPEEIRGDKLFPYPALPHPLHSTGGQVFPQVQIEMFPRLQRFDVDFDLPEAFLPEFPPPMFLQNRPELGDVSRGQVVSINNFHDLFKYLLTPVQLEGLRLLLTPLPQ